MNVKTNNLIILAEREFGLFNKNTIENIVSLYEDRKDTYIVKLTICDPRDKFSTFSNSKISILKVAEKRRSIMVLNRVIMNVTEVGGGVSYIENTIRHCYNVDSTAANNHKPLVEICETFKVKTPKVEESSLPLMMANLRKDDDEIPEVEFVSVKMSYPYYSCIACYDGLAFFSKPTHDESSGLDIFDDKYLVKRAEDKYRLADGLWAIKIQNESETARIKALKDRKLYAGPILSGKQVVGEIIAISNLYLVAKIYCGHGRDTKEHSEFINKVFYSEPEYLFIGVANIELGDNKCINLPYISSSVETHEQAYRTKLQNMRHTIFESVKEINKLSDTLDGLYKLIEEELGRIDGKEEK